MLVASLNKSQVHNDQFLVWKMVTVTAFIYPAMTYICGHTLYCNCKCLAITTNSRQYNIATYMLLHGPVKF